MKKHLLKIRKAMNENGQGAIEYILLLVVVVAIGLAFRKPIVEAVEKKMTELSGAIGDFKVN